MVEFKERLKLAMEHAHVGREALRTKLKVSRVAIDKLLDGRSKSMSAENCAHAARYMGVDLFWLATGEGAMQRDQEGAHAVCEQTPIYVTAMPPAWPMLTVTLAEFQSLTDRQQGHIEGQIRAMGLEKSDPRSAPPRPGLVIPFPASRRAQGTAPQAQ